MHLHVLAAYDKKAKAFLTPFFVPTVAVGVRSFTEAANNPQQQVCKFPEDFSLFLLGTFSDEDGHFNLTAQPTHVAEAINLKRENFGVQSKVA